MTALTKLVMPGYYKHDTRLMGDYYGIMDNQELVAMAGERICLNGLTEVSAVVTHPAFTGRKFAQQLVALVVNKNLAAGIVPFLHTGHTNERAIRMYEYLGFKKRRLISFTKIKREK
jgi:predicted GNAT family acetyltransferase